MWGHIYGCSRYGAYLHICQLLETCIYSHSGFCVLFIMEFIHFVFALVVINCMNNWIRVITRLWLHHSNWTNDEYWVETKFVVFWLIYTPCFVNYKIFFRNLFVFLIRFFLIFRCINKKISYIYIYLIILYSNINKKNN